MEETERVLALGDRVPRVVRWVLRPVGVGLMVVGVGAWVIFMLAMMGVFGEMRGVEWPVARGESMVRLADGRYAVAVGQVGRVQVYGADLRFQYGWQSGSNGSDDVLVAGAGGEVAVYDRRKGGRYELAGVFRADGTPVAGAASRVGTIVAVRPAGGGAAQGGAIRMAWWEWPFSGFVRAWVCMMVGLVVMAGLQTGMQKEKARRWAEGWKKRWGGGQ